MKVNNEKNPDFFVYPLYEGLSVSKSDNKFGFVNQEFEEIIPHIYNCANEFEDGFAAVKIEKWGFINIKNILVIPCIYDEVRSFKEGLVAVRITNKWGFLNGRGEVVISFLYDEVFDLNDGTVRAKKSRKFTILDLNRFEDFFGENDDPRSYNEAKYYKEFFEKGIYIKGEEKFWGLLDQNNIELLPFEYEGISAFEDGVAEVCKETVRRLYGLVDTFGNLIIPCIYTYLTYCDANSHYLVAVGDLKYGRYGYVSKSGETVIPCDHSSTIFVYNEGLAPFDISDEFENMTYWGFIDCNLNIAVPCIYEEVNSFNQGLAAVKKDGKWGYINRLGSQIIPIIYERTLRFENNLASVMIGGKWGFINLSGKVVIPLIYENVLSFSGGLCAVEKEGKMGFIDRNGMVIIPIKYEFRQNSYFRRGFVQVELRNENSKSKYCGEKFYIGKDGSRLSDKFIAIES